MQVDRNEDKKIKMRRAAHWQIKQTVGSVKNKNSVKTKTHQIKVEQ